MERKRKFGFNTRELRANVRRHLQTELPEKARRAMERAAELLSYEAKQLTPVDEGNLTDDVTSRAVEYGKSYAAVVYIPENAPSSEYAIPMHEHDYDLGENSLAKQAKTGRIVGKGYLIRAAEESRDAIGKIIERELGCVVNRFVLYYANVKKRISGKWRMHTNDMIYRMNLGLKSNFCYRGARELGAATLATTGNLSMRYFGFYERGHLGVICHRVTEIGKILTGVFAVGATKEFGRNYCRN